MVEPVPYVFERLMAKYGQIKHLNLLNCAVDDKPGTREFYYVAESDDELPAWYDQLGSFLIENILKHREYIPDIQTRIRTIHVPCVSVAALLEKGADVVQSDVEGYDDVMVSAVLDTPIRPQVIIYEHIHLGTKKGDAIDERLAGCGYIQLKDGQNTIAVRSDCKLLLRELTITR